MRSIHPVSAHEQFIASGEYTYKQDDVTLPTIQRWTIHKLPDGAFLYRIDHDSRALDGTSVLAEGYFGVSKSLERFDSIFYDWRISGVNKVTRLSYLLHEGGVDLVWKHDRNDSESKEISLPDKTVLFPFGIVMEGSIVHRLALALDEHRIFLLSVRQVNLDNSPHRASVRKLETRLMTIGNKEIQAEKYEMTINNQCNYYWLDEHSIPLQVETSIDSKPTIIRVTRYAHQ